MNPLDDELTQVICIVIGPAEATVMDFEDVIQGYLYESLKLSTYAKIEQLKKVVKEGRCTCELKITLAQLRQLEHKQGNKTNKQGSFILNFFPCNNENEVIFDNGRLAKSFYLLNIPQQREMTGGYGQILIAQHKIDGNIFIVKRRQENIPMKQTQTIKGIQNLKYIREASNMMKLSHPHIVRAYDWWLEQDNYCNKSSTGLNQTSESETQNFNNNNQSISMYILMEHIGELGNTHNMFSFTKQIISNIPDIFCKRKLIHSYFKQILSAVCFIHYSGYVHRDIKPENVFVDGLNSLCKIGDFGFSKLICAENKQGKLLLHKTPSQSYGTICYQPPELRSCFDSSGDLFNLGLVLFDMCNGMIDRKQSHYNLTYIQGDKKFPSGFKSDFEEECNLIEVLCDQNPDQRQNYFIELQKYDNVFESPKSSADLLDNTLSTNQSIEMSEKQTSIETSCT